MKSEKSLTENELKRFKGSIEAIIRDSKNDGSSDYDYDNSDDDMNQHSEDENESDLLFETKPKFDRSSLPDDLKDNPFVGEFQGGSTWGIEGMEDMTEKEYYAALNKKLDDLKTKKIAMFGRDALNNPALSYEESLNKRNKK